MAAWESPLSANISQYRSDEISRIWIAAQLKAFTLSFFFAGAHWPTFVAITVFAGSGGVLTPACVFSVFTLFGSMRMTTAGFLPMGINMWNELKIALQRMEDLLMLESPGITVETDEPGSTQNQAAADKKPGCIKVQDVCCRWKDAEPTTSNNLQSKGVDVLHGINLTITEGETVVVFGYVKTDFAVSDSMQTFSQQKVVCCKKCRTLRHSLLRFILCTRFDDFAFFSLPFCTTHAILN